MGLFSTLCDNQCWSFVGVLPNKALKTIFPENYRLHLNFVTFPHILGEQRKLFKEGECNSPLQSYHCANGRGAPRAPKMSSRYFDKIEMHPNYPYSSSFHTKTRRTIRRGTHAKGGINNQFLITGFSITVIYLVKPDHQLDGDNPVLSLKFRQNPIDSPDSHGA